MHAIRCFSNLCRVRKQNIPVYKTHLIRPKNKVVNNGFSSEDKITSLNQLIYNPYWSPLLSKLNLNCYAYQSLRACLSAYTGHSRGIRELNYLT